MKENSEVITVSIVEDDVKVRGSLARMIDSTPGFTCASQHPDAENALKEILVIQPTVVLMDINLPKMNGVECVRKLKELLPDVQVVMLTAPTSSSMPFPRARAGICSSKARTNKSSRPSVMFMPAARR